MKKILAGILATASLMAMTVSASAATKNVTKAGDLTDDVAVTAPKVVLNLVMPSKLAASLNPYGADIVLGVKNDSDVTTSTGITSVAYTIENKSVDYGVYIDATATTTITTTDKDKWNVTTTKVAKGTKSAQMALVAGADVDAIKTLADGDTPTASKAADGTDQGVLVLNSAATADKDKGLVAGQVAQSKVFYIKAAADAENSESISMALVGKLAESSTGAGAKEVVWNEDDAINVSLVLKVVAGPKAFPTA